MSKIVLIIVVIAAVAFFVLRSFGNKEAAAENAKAGQAFLAKNAEEEGVKSTASGLQYKVLTPGTGNQHPTASDRVTVHYHGTLLDGSVFDSSVERGETIKFGLNQVIPGWTEGLQLMVVGEKTRFYIPSNLAYADRATGKIGPGSTLIFDVELFAINE